MYLLTIFTASYNRAHLLPRLYDSISTQEITQVEWLIVDDGSTDNTKQVVAELQQQANFPIRYINKPNGGKHTAINLGLQKAEGKWFFSVDSDDCLTIDSIRKIKNLLRKTTSTTIGLIALKETLEHQLIGKAYPTDFAITSLHQIELNGNNGERSIVLLTSAARNHLFPEISTERFMTEAVLFDAIDQPDGFIATNDILTSCEYQIDGLSSDHPFKLMCKYPGGYKVYYRNRIDRSTSMHEMFSYIMRYHAFRYLYNGAEAHDYCGKHSFAVLLLKPFSKIFAAHYRKF